MAAPAQNKMPVSELMGGDGGLEQATLGQGKEQVCSNTFWADDEMMCPALRTDCAEKDKNVWEKCSKCIGGYSHGATCKRSKSFATKKAKKGLWCYVQPDPTCNDQFYSTKSRKYWAR